MAKKLVNTHWEARWSTRADGDQVQRFDDPKWDESEREMRCRLWAQQRALELAKTNTDAYTRVRCFEVETHEEALGDYTASKVKRAVWPRAGSHDRKGDD